MFFQLRYYAKSACIGCVLMGCAAVSLVMANAANASNTEEDGHRSRLRSIARNTPRAELPPHTFRSIITNKQTQALPQKNKQHSSCESIDSSSSSQGKDLEASIRASQIVEEIISFSSNSSSESSSSQESDVILLPLSLHKPVSPEVIVIDSSDDESEGGWDLLMSSPFELSENWESAPVSQKSKKRHHEEDEENHAPNKKRKINPQVNSRPTSSSSENSQSGPLFEKKRLPIWQKSNSDPDVYWDHSVKKWEETTQEDFDKELARLSQFYPDKKKVGEDSPLAKSDTTPIKRASLVNVKKKAPTKNTKFTDPPSKKIRDVPEGSSRMSPEELKRRSFLKELTKTARIDNKEAFSKKLEGYLSSVTKKG